MQKQDVKKHQHFKDTNKAISSNLTALDRTEKKLSSDLSSIGVKWFKGELTGERYMRLTQDIANSSLPAKNKEKLYNQMNKIREQRMNLGDSFRIVGLKDANDFSALGETPKV
jgi:hypothetical protein